MAINSDVRLIAGAYAGRCVRIHEVHADGSVTVSMGYGSYCRVDANMIEER